VILTLNLDGPPQVRLKGRVQSEEILMLAGLGTKAEPGIYTAQLNPYGAVSVTLPDKSQFGLKPGEFEWCAPPFVVGQVVKVEESEHRVIAVDLVMKLADGREWIWGGGFVVPPQTREPVAMRVTLQREFRRICAGCGQEIDPNCCGCGRGLHTGYEEGHIFVPAGCQCLSMPRAEHAARSRLRRSVSDAAALVPMTAGAARSGDAEALGLLADQIARGGNGRPDIDDLFAMLGGWKDRS